jgi:hypothetical protein
VKLFVELMVVLFLELSVNSKLKSSQLLLE